MKKTLGYIFAVLAFFAMVLYVGNVLVIGTQIGQLATTLGLSVTSARWLAMIFDIIVIVSPGCILFGCIAKNFYGYGELNVKALLENKDDQQMSRVLEGIAKQPQSPDSTLDKHNLRNRCEYALRRGNRMDKHSFLKEYYGHCEEDTKHQAREYALLAAVSVVLSPRAAGDTLALLIWQCRIISSTLRIYGGRPSKLMVLKLYAKILMHAFVAGSIDEVFDQFAFGAMDGKMLSFVTQALAAVATCVRTASLTRYYLDHGLDADRKKALKEALPEITQGILEVMQSDELKEAFKKFANVSFDVVKTIAQKAGKFVMSLITQNNTSREDKTAAEQETFP